MKIKLIIILIMFFIFGQNAEAIRGVESGSVSFDTVNTKSSANNSKDKNEKLYTVVGKSQLIKFDQNIKRISIADPALADLVMLSPKQLLLNGKKAGRTSLIFWGDSQTPLFYNLIVEQDTDAFIQAVQNLTPNEDVNITFTDSGAILSGHISSTSTKKKIDDLAKAYKVNLLNIAESVTKQVLLEVKVTEASRKFTKDLSSSFAVGDGVVKVPDGSHAAFGMAGANKGLQYIFTNNAAKLSWQLDLAETKGTAKILAEPKLLVTDGSKASFNVGNEVPVPSSLGQYGNVSYEFKNTGVNLQFQPTILEQSRRIQLRLTPEVSEVDASVSMVTPGGGSVPGFKTRKVDTTVELADGETLIIAGLLNQKSSNTRSQVPLIGNIPFVGWLFSSLNDVKDDSELLIIVTPKIVDPDNLIDRI